MKYKSLKRIFDFLGSSILLIYTAPIIIVIITIMRIKMGSPVIFSQKRPGLNEKIFKIYKFRTMTEEKDIRGDLLPSHKRVTPLGQFLRSTSLDELPELWNVLKGDMSLVGPRPLLVEYLKFYSKEQHRRHEVRPGMTGLAQVSGRNAIEFDDRFRLDVEYVDNLSFLYDIKIILKTIPKLFKREGISFDERKLRSRFEAAIKKYKNE
jgi:lipopolysaccharide/colanic/teichoic acid biosynthesis glycosyltransferase